MKIPKLKLKFKAQQALKPLLIATVTAITLSGCGNSENFVFTNSPPVITGNAPTALADQYTALGNTTMNVSALQGVLANDSDFTDATVEVVTAPTSGTVTLNQDGSFSYTPPTGFTGQDSFTYSLTNQFGSSQAQVTISLNQTAWFVNNSAAAGDGSQGSPFTTLKAAETASSNGDIIFVFAGDGTSAGQNEGIVLKPNQQLLSERVGLAFQNGTLTRSSVSAQVVPNQVIVPADSNVRPVITNTTGAGIELAENNTVRGFQVEDTANEGILSDNATLTPGHTITDNVVDNPGSGFSAIRLEALGSQTTISENTISGVDGAIGLELSSSFSGTDSPAITVDGNSFEDAPGDDPEQAAVLELDGLGATLTTGTPTLSFTFTNNEISGDSDGTGWENALGFGALLNDQPLGASVTGQLTANLSSNTVNGTDDKAFFLQFLGGDMLAGNVDLSLTADQNGFSNTGDEAFEIYLESGINTSGTISNNTKSNGDGGGIDLRSGRNSTDVTNTELTIAQNQFTASGSGERGIQLRADGASAGQTTIFCIQNTVTDDGDAISAYNIRSNNDANLTVVSDGDTVSGFLTNGLLATSLGDSTLLVGVRNGEFSAVNDEGVFMEGAGTSTLCAQVLNNTFDAFRIRRNAGDTGATVQLESLPANTTVDTNTGPIDDSDNVGAVNLGDCNIPATPSL